RVRRLETAPDSDFLLAADGALIWRGDDVARLAAGDSPLEPRIELLPAEHLEGGARESVRRRLGEFVRAEIRRALAPLFVAEQEWSGAARAILFRLAERPGIAETETASVARLALGGVAWRQPAATPERHGGAARSGDLHQIL